MGTIDNILSFRAENLRQCFKFEELQVLGELSKSYIITPSPQKELVLQGNFSKDSVSYVLQQLGVAEKDFKVIVFPNSKTTTIKLY